ncbi:MAG TPA: AmmeMemoRadiSam system radical SAM enzyme [Candidatus Nanoarchaeia archaeon]|nr:AmmeMemoRadiSam system radical SAM enzyme [Candidatus Nanoarchaeia archaeon]
MHEAILYEPLENKKIRCTACKWYCEVPEGKAGICSIRYNKEGKLYLLTYGKPCSVAIDPIEKKPLFHFYPGTQILSIGTFGCNFGCEFCQNWTISQTTKEAQRKSPLNQFETIMGIINKNSDDLSPKQVVDICVERNIPSIAFTYNEPTIFSEYAHDIAILAKKKGIKIVYVSSGYETKETMKYMHGLIDAMNIDLKAYNEKTYTKICKTKLSHVLDTIKEIAKKKIWLEITTLIIPGINDSDKELEDIAEFIYSCNPEMPWHVTAFHPDYKMLDTMPTPASTLKRAHEIGIKAGLKFVYTGNIPGLEYENTHCPHCDELLIERWGMSTKQIHLNKGACPHCRNKLSGRWI